MTSVTERGTEAPAFLPGLMQPTPLVLHAVFERMRTIYGDTRVAGPEGVFTYAELGERILRLCRVLVEELDVRPGDRVATFGFNSVRHFELYWAVPLVGAVLHTVNVRLFPEQIAQIVGHAGDKVLFFDGEVADRLGDVDGLGIVEQWVRMQPGGDAALPTLTPEVREYEDLLAACPDPIGALPDVPEDAAANLCYTSGTTGMPKGVLQSHRSLWLHAMAACMADHLALTQHDTVLPIVPLFHACGWGMPYAAPFTGAGLVFHGSDSFPANVARLIREHRVTVGAAVPTIWKELLPLLRSGDADLSTVRGIYVGGSATPRPLAEAYGAHGIDMVQIWGMTETGPLACVSQPRRHHGRDVRGDALYAIKEKTGTIMSGLEARVVGETGEAVPWDGETVGELEVRGPWIAAAYYNDPIGSVEKLHDGWLRTGDMAWMERDGTFRIVDRAKDLVKSGGEWISSVELEGALLGHPAIRDAAVVGLPHPKWDERPVAFVVADGHGPGQEPTVESVHAFLADKVAKWWLPDAVVVVEEIPKTSVGKIDKKVLRAAWEARAGELFGIREG
ncbi:MAG TPA: long-chain-fatty-acid--CoA ligase [Egibacteraceae bacterium]|nr:long-chain-fatty-acid--CoA ligase [Egibacteraceae bacterium]